MPTFGKTDAGSTNGTSTATKVAVSSASPSSTGVVQSATAQLGFTTTTAIEFGIYADSGGSPGALLAVSDVASGSGSTVTAWNFTFSGANLITVTSGTTYWIGPAWRNDGSTSYGHDAVTGARLEGTGWTWPDISSPSWAASQSGPMAAYVTYVLASGDRSLRMTTTAVMRSYFY